MKNIIWYILLSVTTAIHCSDHWADQTLNKLTLDEKIGQLLFVAVQCNPQDQNDPLFGKISESFGLTEKHDEEYARRMIKQYHVGGILYICLSTVEEEMQLTKALQKQSPLPLLIAQDFEWGLNMRIKDIPALPHAMTLGALTDNELIYRMGKEVAQQCKKIGVHINLAPVFDVNNNPLNPIINDRSFGENKHQVAQKAIAYMQGLQDGGVIACAKHFPGHGDVEVDSHAALPIIPHAIDRLDNLELYPFKQAIKAGVQAIMPAHLHIPALDATPGIPSSLSPNIVSDLLRKKLGFDGFIISDGLVMRGVTDYCAEDGDVELQALLAGHDILIFPKDVGKAIHKIKDAIQNGAITVHEIDKRVLKILRAKERLNLHQTRSVPSDSYKKIQLPSTDILKKQLFTNAITLAKNENIIPVASDTMHTVLCFHIGDPAKTTFNQELFEEGIPTVYIPTPTKTNQINSLIKRFAHKNATIIFAIFNMNKFAKQDFGISEQTRQLIAQCNQECNVVLVLFGSPYSLTFFGNEKAIIVAYEDDPDAQEAAAHVILGKHKPTGMLPVTASEQFKAK